MANGGIGQTAGVGAKRNPNCVWVKNTLGRDLDRYAAVCIGSPTPVELHTGKNDQVFLLVNGSVAGRESVAAPSVDPVLGILAEPIANDRLGLVQIAGVTPARFRHTEALVVASYIPPSATISDLDDALVFSQFVLSESCTAICRSIAPGQLGSILGRAWIRIVPRIHLLSSAAHNRNYL